jgi:ProP effector
MRKQELHPRTEIINKKQKHQAKLARNEALLWLATLFPRSFDTSVLIQPLKEGIMSDILAHADKAVAAGISKSKLREAVVIFTRRIDYLTCLKAREMRVDLEGNPVVAVTEAEAQQAALKIKKRVEKSSKNARKSLINKPVGQNYSRPSETTKHPSEQQRSPYYPERPPAFSAQTNIQPARTTSVVITRKVARAYDPDAVARMKEKLGLSRKRDLEETT